MTRRIGRATSEDGNALLLALLFVVVFGILLGAILQFSGTGIETAQHIADVRDVQHGVDGAVEGAINSLRTATPYGSCVPDGFGGCSSTVPCPDYASPNATGDTPVVVTCQPVAVSGNPTPPNDIPNWAILTVGTSPGDGFHAISNGTGNGDALQVNGGIFSYGDLSVTGSLARINVIGRAIGKAQVAGATCDASRIFATVPVVCATTDPAVNGANAASYNYPHQTIALPTASPTTPPTAGATAVDPIPTCVGAPGTVVSFAPGLYTVLPRYLYAKSGCTGDVWWFTPGTYYFRFPDTDGLFNLAAPQHVSVVGGTPSCTGTSPCVANWSGSSLSSTVKPFLASGNSCQKDASGVQFIFGGKSQVSAPGNDTYLQLCAKDTSASPPTKQQIAVYALRQADETSSSQVPNAPLTPKTANATFAPPTTATTPTSAVPMSFSIYKTADTVVINTGTFASASCGSPATCYGIPEGSTVQGVSLQFSSAPQAGVSFTESLSVSIPSRPSPISCGNPCDLTAAIGQSGLPMWRDINQLAASLTVKRGNSGSNPASYTLSSMQLTVTYTPPRFEKTTLVLQPPTRCELINPVPQCLIDAANSNTTIRIDGTVFAPDSGLHVLLHNKGASFFHRGVVAKTIDAELSSSATQDEAPFQLPSSNASREVLLIAHLNTASGTVRLRARVQFIDVNDLGNSDPTDDIGVPGYKIKIRNWQYVRG